MGAQQEVDVHVRTEPMKDEPVPSYENYKYVIAQVLADCFKGMGNDHAGVYGLDDLEQEGCIALLSALNTYDPTREDALFSTYAYAAIYKATARYSQLNSSPLTVARASDVNLKGSEVAKERHRMANRVAFTGNALTDKLASIVSRDKDPNDEVDQLDLVEYCLEEMLRGLDAAEFALMSLWAEGASYREIGTVIGVGRVSARKKLRKILVKAVGILKSEVHL
jgi:RNA polymerase sigma factor (sigma-70 family)